MARLIDYHTNCNCGADVHTTAHLDEEGRLTVLTQAQGQPATAQDADAGEFLGEASEALIGARLYDQLMQDAGADPVARHLEMVEAVAWLAEQLAGDTLDAAEVRARFGLPTPSQPSDVNDAPTTPADAAAAATAPARPRPGRRGGG